jgi:hypothetical protein
VKGFISPMLIMGVGLVLLGAAAAIQTKRLDNCKQEFAVFVANVKLLGEQAEKKKKEKEAADKLSKEKADAELKKVRSDLAVVSKRLRDERARSSLTPEASPTTKFPLLACFDRALLQSALSRFEDAVAAGFESCDAGTADLDNAKRWAVDTFK